MVDTAPAVCPHCEEELDSMWYARSVQLQWDGKEWIEKHVFSEDVSCPRCHGDIALDDLDSMGRPVFKAE